jgi:hypothetical protein
MNHQLLKKYLAHVMIVMLSGMDDNILYSNAIAFNIVFGYCPADRCGLDELGPCADNRRNFEFCVNPR